MFDIPWILPWADLWAWIAPHPEPICVSAWLLGGAISTGVAAALSDPTDFDQWTDGIGKGIVVGLLWPVLICIALIALAVFLLALPSYLVTSIVASQLRGPRPLPERGGKPNH